MNLAILSPDNNAISETFIQSHKRIKADRIYFYYGGPMPSYLQDHGIINISRDSNDFKTIFKLASKINIFDILFSHFSLRETLLAHSFRKNKIDIVLAEFGPTAVECVNVCKKLHIPLITHFHGYDVASVEKKYKDRYKEIFDYSTYLIVVSKEMAKDLEKLGAPKEKIIYTPCGPNELFYTSEPHFHNKNLVFVGRFVDKKAPYYLILAFQKVIQKHPDAKLTMVGDGPLFNTCHNLIKSLDLSSSVTLTGVKTPDEIKNIHSDSYAYVQHSVETLEGDKEGTPVGIMEASAAALPVISTKHAGIKDVIIHEESGLLCDEHDINKMAENIIYILDNPDSAKAMGEKGRENIKNNFSLQNHLALLSDCVEKACSK